MIVNHMVFSTTKKRILLKICCYLRKNLETQVAFFLHGSCGSKFLFSLWCGSASWSCSSPKWCESATTTCLQPPGLDCERPWPSMDPFWAPQFRIRLLTLKRLPEMRLDLLSSVHLEIISLRGRVLSLPPMKVVLGRWNSVSRSWSTRSRSIRNTPGSTIHMLQEMPSTQQNSPHAFYTYGRYTIKINIIMNYF